MSKKVLWFIAVVAGIAALNVFFRMMSGRADATHPASLRGTRIAGEEMSAIVMPELPILIFCLAVIAVVVIAVKRRSGSRELAEADGPEDAGAPEQSDV